MPLALREASAVNVTPMIIDVIEKATNAHFEYTLSVSDDVLRIEVSIPFGENGESVLKTGWSTLYGEEAFKDFYEGFLKYIPEKDISSSETTSKESAYDIVKKNIDNPLCMLIPGDVPLENGGILKTASPEAVIKSRYVYVNEVCRGVLREEDILKMINEYYDRVVTGEFPGAFRDDELFGNLFEPSAITADRLVHVIDDLDELGLDVSSIRNIVYAIVTHNVYEFTNTVAQKVLEQTDMFVSSALYLRKI